ncbi:MAG TPA: RNA 2',3'-cyclic phosphodiesterase [Blastocatellia bacterium]
MPKFYFRVADLFNKLVQVIAAPRLAGRLFFTQLRDIDRSEFDWGCARPADAIFLVTGDMKESDKERDDSVRTFICIDIPGSIKARIEELQGKLRQVGGQVSWVKSSNIHLTIKFLGNVPTSQVAAVCEGVRRAAGSVNPFRVEVSGSGGFPSSRSPSVLWVGLAESAPELQRLYENVEYEMFRLKFPRESRPFSPHLTIGRLRTRENAQRLGEMITAVGFDPEGFDAREVIVMRSNLKPTGAIYTPIETLPIGQLPD